jgi:UDP-N-acetyl-2-amino-2-deoxyglucuronate dehydrogenase
LDRYFQDASFFTEFERFDRHLEKLRRGPKENHIHYLTICSPNNLHDAHIRLALRVGAHALCEKPLVLNPWNLDALEELENEFKGSRVFTILQLRVHPSLIELKKKISSQKNNKRYNITLTYITSRGVWYDHSWKSVTEKSGGIGTNIGVHFFDMLSWIFGPVQNSYVYLSEHKRMSGALELKNADVRWFLSTDRSDLPKEAVEAGKPTFRSIEVNDEEIQFSEGFTDLHTKVYEETLAGRGFGIEDARQSIKLVYDIRNAKVEGKVDKDKLHPFLKRLKR